MTDGPSSARRAQGEPADASDLQRLIDDASLGLVRIDPHMAVRAANGAAHRLLERRPRTLLGRSVIEVFLDHRIETLIQEAVGGRGGTAEFGVGRERVLLVRTRPGSDGGAWVGLEDVTELRRLQRIRSEFIDNLSHELRTPLSTIRLLTETLSADLARIEVPQKVRERVAKIDVETGHLVQMVTELLDLSRIEQSAAEVELVEMSIERVLVAAVERIRTFADRQGVALRLELPEGGLLPRIRGDEERLGQLLINLLHNAVKFSGPRTEVTVRAAVERDELIVSVADQGVGIPKRDLDRVFERFYKVDKARVRGVGGTGLGLAIARHIVEGHGGRIWVDSEEGSGSTFHVAIPAAARPALPES